MALASSLLDVRRAVDDPSGPWRIVSMQGLTSVEGLYRLRINPDTQFAARNLSITADDLHLTMSEGTVFQVEAESGVTRAEPRQLVAPRPHNKAASASH